MIEAGLPTRIESPYTFSSRSLAGETTEGLANETISIGELERIKLQKMHEVLSHPRLNEFIESGELTLGIIKPLAQEGRRLPDTDDEAAEVILHEIGEENVVFNFSTKLSVEQVEKFYGENKERDKKRKIGKTRKTVWDSIMEFMPSGPLTFVLIRREDGNAIQWWREKMGPTHPAEAGRKTIRGKYGLEEKLPNNLVHGSDSPESVEREVAFLRELVANLHQQAESTASKTISEEKLRNLHIIGDREQLLRVKRVFDSGMGGDAWTYGYEVLTPHPRSGIRKRYVRERNLISMGGDIVKKARDEEQKVHMLGELGIPMPRFYGREGASLYQDFVTEDGTEEVYEKLRNNEPLTPENEKLLEQLIDIGVRLDSAGFSSLGFLSDLIFDSEKKRFLLMDPGTDLGWPSEKPNSLSLSELVKKFRNHSEYITKIYHRKMRSIRKREEKIAISA